MANNITEANFSEDSTISTLPLAAIIIGDEILSAQRQDQHLYWLSKTLSERGLVLSWVHYIGDNCQQIANAIRYSLVPANIVFCFGGIGTTPDDHTRQAAAMAFDEPLIQHPQATQCIIQRFADKAYPNRIRMAQLPATATLIPNPINQVPGFSMQHHHFLPGFPEMAWPMVQWLLGTRYSHLSQRVRPIRLSVIVIEGIESELLPLMETLVAAYPTIRLASLPSYGNSCYAGPHIELSISGPIQQAQQAFAQLISGLEQLEQRFIRMAHNATPSPPS